jgi:hypothetical protein
LLVRELLVRELLVERVELAPRAFALPERREFALRPERAVFAVRAVPPALLLRPALPDPPLAERCLVRSALRLPAGRGLCCAICPPLVAGV